MKNRDYVIIYKEPDPGTVISSYKAPMNYYRIRGERLDPVIKDLMDKGSKILEIIEVSKFIKFEYKLEWKDKS